MKLYNVDIGFFSRSGVARRAGRVGTTTKVVVARSDIHDNGGAGVVAAPSSGGHGARCRCATATSTRTGCGLVASQFGLSNIFATNCGTNAANAQTGATALNAYGNGISDSDDALRPGDRARPPPIRLSENKIYGSLSPALVGAQQRVDPDRGTTTGSPATPAATAPPPGAITPL